MADPNTDTLSETDSFMIWRSVEDGEYVYHLELGGVSLHLASDEWEELLLLIQQSER